MSIINNRFISAFLDAFPVPKKKVFEPVRNTDAYLDNDSLGISAAGSVASETKIFDTINVSPAPVLDSKLVEGKITDCEKWERITGKLRKFYGEKIYRSWLKFLTFVKVENTQLVLSVPTGFIREWIMVNYSDNILEFFRIEDRSVSSLEILIREEKYKENGNKSLQVNAPSVHIKSDEESVNSSNKSGLADNLSSSLDWNRTFDNFVVGKPNELAFTASKRVAEAAELPIPGSNPLFLYGGVGLGKTHLMHAIVWHIKEHYKNRRVIYLSAEKFMYKYITALRNKDMMSFKQIFRSVDVLMVDDVQFISGKDSTQEEFFHTFNALIEQNKQLVISADRSPSDLQGVEERIQSRLSWGLVADINHTTFELRVGILESKLEQMTSRVVVPKKVIEFMARNIVSNVRELEGALNKVIAHADITGSVITVDSTKDLLADILRTNSVAVTLDNILLKVSEYFNIKISDLKSQRRVKDVSYARQVCMYLSKLLTQRSLLDIGKFLGGRDHATVIHAVKKIEVLIKHDVRVAEDIKILTKRLT
ncbi:chromosomal replication initiator protein DnaA [Neorickettsia helminthoeca str. Oregon]|uniref:Chromosomal replication initiator protein DnaA n=1 Tax=Neorickettsia helminthoeca str. Oregon TaxID=1286528 RepID=X5HJF0_9RICK|nr:chromosomal replication initiator protein DnaA [Neorickettsia helminthoeca]AHX11204.1 chromosomal replication initiator protein DnaA [Neorickettsia helminthoeca str. Oregon]